MIKELDKELIDIEEIAKMKLKNDNLSSIYAKRKKFVNLMAK